MEVRNTEAEDFLQRPKGDTSPLGSLNTRLTQEQQQTQSSKLSKCSDCSSLLSQFTSYLVLVKKLVLIILKKSYCLSLLAVITISVCILCSLVTVSLYEKSYESIYEGVRAVQGSFDFWLSTSHGVGATVLRGSKMMELVKNISEVKCVMRSFMHYTLPMNPGNYLGHEHSKYSFESPPVAHFLMVMDIAQEKSRELIVDLDPLPPGYIYVAQEKFRSLGLSSDTPLPIQLSNPILTYISSDYTAETSKPIQALMESELSFLTPLPYNPVHVFGNDAFSHFRETDFILDSSTHLHI